MWEGLLWAIARRATTIVFFAEEGDNEVLGIYALEGLGSEVDPVTKQLREVEAIWETYSRIYNIVLLIKVALAFI